MTTNERKLEIIKLIIALEHEELLKEIHQLLSAATKGE